MNALSLVPRRIAENRLGSPGPDGSRPITGARFVVRLPALPDNWQASDDN